MQADLKHKRKVAGFIRTNSSKALPTFKVNNKSDSSDDFSSFENSPHPRHLQQQDSEFSPYKNSMLGSPALHRPPLPHHPVAKNSRKQLVQPELFTNEKLKRNYQTNNYVESPGQIVNRSKSRSNREQQIREAIRKRVEVQKQLAQIDQICQEIDQFRPHLSTENQHRTPRQPQGRTVEKNGKQLNKQRPSFSQQKQQYKYQIPFNSIKSPKYAQNSQNHNILNRQKSPKMHPQEPQSSQKYQFEDSKEFSNSPSSSSSVEDQEEDYSSFQCEQTFKPNANEQILTSIEEYKKLHPEFQANRNKLGTQNRNYAQARGLKNKVKLSTQGERYQEEDRIRTEHEKARRKFISNHEEESYEDPQQFQQPEIEKSEQSQEERLIQQYPTEQFKKATLKQAHSPIFGKSNLKSGKALEDKNGIHKAKGGICFDLDINQFTQYEAKPSQPKTTLGTRKPKKMNSKQEILKRRQMAKNYDKEARAKVFAGF